MNSSSASKSRDGMHSVPLGHSKLQELVQPFLVLDDTNDTGTTTTSDGDKTCGSRIQSTPGDVLLDDLLFDFGCRYRIIVCSGGRGDSCSTSACQSSSCTTDDEINEKTGSEQDEASSEQEISYSRGNTIVLHVGIIGWEQVKRSAIAQLQKILGRDNVMTVTTTTTKGETNTEEQNQHEELHPINHVAPGYDVGVRIYSNALPQDFDGKSMGVWLSNIRAVILGSQLREALMRLQCKKSSPGARVGDDGDSCVNNDGSSFAIPIQRRASGHITQFYYPGTRSDIKSTSSSTSSSSSPSSIIVSCQSDRVTVVTPFAFRDETDRALARLFLQQFREAQRRAVKSLTAVPICNFKRGNDPPREILDHTAGRSCGMDKVGGGGDDGNSNQEHHVNDTKNLAGYLSITFLEHHVDTTLRVEAAVRNVLMLVDFIDYHVKCSKSNMHSRMRQKKVVLLKRLMSDR